MDYAGMKKEVHCSVCPGIEDNST